MSQLSSVNFCKLVIADDIDDVFNHIIEKRDFPDLWFEEITSTVYKVSTDKLVAYHRGITFKYQVTDVCRF